MGSLGCSGEHEIAAQVAYAFIEEAALQSAPAAARDAQAIRPKRQPQLHIGHQGERADHGNIERLFHRFGFPRSHIRQFR